MVHWFRVLGSVVFTASLLVGLASCGQDVAGCSGDEAGDCNPSGSSESSDDESTPEIDAENPQEPQEPAESDNDECDPLVIQPLYDASTILETDVVVHTPDALVTYLADRARDRHAREDIVNGVPFRKYDHYLSFYWEQRIANIEIVDRVAKGGSGITFNFTTLAELNPAEFRTFYANTDSVAMYHNNMSDFLNQGVTLTEVVASQDYPGEDEFRYTATIFNQSPENRDLVMGDRIEVELSQFLLSPRNGRENYYGTAFLYVVGEGVRPWYAKELEEATTESERASASFDSFPIPEKGWLGGLTTLPYQYSNEPIHRFKQMAGNISTLSGHPFMDGRRLHHTDFLNGQHSEADNPVFEEQVGKVGPIAVAVSCITCHLNNGRGVAPAEGQVFAHAVVKVASDEQGTPHPAFGDSLQPLGLVTEGSDPLLRIESEDYAFANGVQTEATTDTGGGFNIGYIDAGDSLTYENTPFSVESTGSFLVAFRVSSAVGGGRLALTGPSGSPVYGEIDIPNTGGWQSWATLTLPLTLASGEYTFEIHAASGGWNINWFEVMAIDDSGTEERAVVLAEYEMIQGEYGDGEPYTLRKPVYEFDGTGPEYFSVRVAPQLIGLGLLEALDESLLETLADPCDEDGDGISGRLRTLPAASGPGAVQVGRFGLKADQPSVVYQIASALNRDMGVTTSIYPLLDQETHSAGEPEISAEELEQMRRYVSLLGVPARRLLTNPQALRGEELFTEASCDSCHKTLLTTGARHPYAELREQSIRPFTDLLLHDMGEGLADSFHQPEASGSEWRTAPLWGIGLSAGVSGTQSFLHDGRARDLSEAILWHGGEAEASKEAFRLMPAADRQAMVRFLDSL